MLAQVVSDIPVPWRPILWDGESLRIIDHRIREAGSDYEIRKNGEKSWHPTTFSSISGGIAALFSSLNWESSFPDIQEDIALRRKTINKWAWKKFAAVPMAMLNSGEILGWGNLTDLCLKSWDGTIEARVSKNNGKSVYTCLSERPGKHVLSKEEFTDLLQEMRQSAPRHGHYEELAFPEPFPICKLQGVPGVNGL